MAAQSLSLEGAEGEDEAAAPASAELRGAGRRLSAQTVAEAARFNDRTFRVGVFVRYFLYHALFPLSVPVVVSGPACGRASAHVRASC